ncbi:DNA primase DnaG [Natronobacterium gregoryi]|uniref:DNA primase DnaG n=2 Tax=Natronobacterium gregoryi TaxID=44930 RepID=L0AMA4_NATGS|nr:DNA primase DnaG [Natronobacterium gregoryi]AFZ74317.1 DNA primase [Natronobacterium gregoryi SP2]ELY63549.1 DNA primase [Natronobacterium gregoryi SP2]PLK22173.1 DNA primase [Natronobacterium gregoryi SP2]SFI53602.1 Toprim domain-containing protein [Natronobacterium gregoryi]
MEDTSKYLIHADVTADGVVERSDVVGAIFGQTEGLLGDELDLRDLRQSQKVGRIDVEITSTGGKSHGHLTIATSLDKVETATLAASLETIDRVGPCRANFEVTELEDVRAAKRKAVVERAKELLETGFDDSVMTSEEILAEVRQHVRVEDITEYEALPAGPRVTDSDAIIVVEGRSDVLTLLQYGVKNAIAVEGTNVPDAVAELTRHRTVTAFLDGDRGGDLILEELAQVGDVDYVAFAPTGESVEELDHHQLFTALRNKVPYETVSGLNEPREAVAATDGSATPAPTPAGDRLEADAPIQSGESATVDASDASSSTVPSRPASKTGVGDADSEREAGAQEGTDEVEPETIYDHANAVIRDGTERVRFLDDDGETFDEADASEAYTTLEDAETVPTTILLDEILDQQLLDLAADRGVERIVARALGQFTNRPADVHIHAIDDVADETP